MIDLAKDAFLWGIASAVSLPLGAWIGLAARPGRRITSALMAFGAGALLFALTIELFSQSLEHAVEHGNGVIVATVLGALAGGLLFDLLNQLLNNRGAFTRKLTVAKRHLLGRKRAMARRVIGELSQVTLLQSLPPADIAKLIPHMRRETFEPGDTVFHQGEEGSTLYFIASGEVQILRTEADGRETPIATLGAYDTFGEMALLSHTARNATARVTRSTQVLKAEHHDFDLLLAESPRLREAVQSLFDQRAEELSHRAASAGAQEWKDECIRHLGGLSLHVTDTEVEAATKKAAESKGAPLAIWLGILLDGIPESLIIGMLVSSVSGIRLAFIAGVFLANLPEAMSSAVGMHRSGMSAIRVFLMWGSLCLITGIGAVAGVLILPSDPHGAGLLVVSAIEGLAAGAMLTMIAETMLPEAFEQGGAIVGISTLVGFLAALLVKMV